MSVVVVSVSKRSLRFDFRLYKGVETLGESFSRCKLLYFVSFFYFCINSLAITPISKIGPYPCAVIVFSCLSKTHSQHSVNCLSPFSMTYTDLGY